LRGALGGGQQADQSAALDAFGKIPEFKFCAAKVEKAGARMEAAE
jgi:hypothetical protein